MDSGGGSLGKAQGEILLSAAGALRSLNQVSAGLRGLDSQGASFGTGLQQSLQSLQGSLDAWAASLRNIGQNLTTRLTLPILGVGAIVTNWASDLDESMNKVDVLFGDAADSVLQFSEGSAKNLGMSKQAALDFSSAFAGMLQPVATSSDELAGMSTELTSLTSDFASFHNLSPAEAFTVLQSALAGETEAIRRYGVDVSAAAVEQKAMEMGLASTSAELTEQDKLLARYQLILDQTSEEQGDFARTSDSVSNKMKIARARVQDVGTSFGRLLLPAVSKALDVFESLIDWVDGLSKGMKTWVVGLAAAAAALGPVLIAVSALLPALGALAAVIGFIVSPIGLIVVGIAALAAGLVFAYQHFEGFHNVVNAVATALMDFASGAIQAVIDGWNALTDAFDADGWSGVWDAIKTAALDGIKAIVDAITSTDWMGILQGAWNVLSGAGSWLIGLLGDIGDGLWSWFSDAVSGVSWDSILSTSWDILSGASDWLLEKIGQAAVLTAKLFSWAWEAIQGVEWGNIFKAIINVLKDAGQWIVDKVSSGLETAKNGIKAWAEDLFSPISDAFNGILGWVQDRINDFIDVLNRIPGVDIPKIGGIEEIGTDADNAKQKVIDLQTVLENISTGMSFGLDNQGRGRDSAGGSSYANPYNPTEGGQHIEPRPIEGGTRSWSKDLGDLAQAAVRAKGEVAGAHASLQGLVAFSPQMGVVSDVGVPVFTTTGAAAQTGLGSIGGIAAGMAAALTGAALPAFSGVQLSAATNFASMLAATTSNFAGMNSSATSEASAMNRSVSAEALGMQVSMLGKFALLKTTSTLHFMVMASSAREQGTAMSTALRTGANNAASAVSSALSRIPGIINGIAGQGAAAAYNAGAAISAGFANGMLAYLGQIQSAASAMVAAASAAVVAKAMISSPSKLFRGFGEYVGEGFELGIRSMIPDVARASAALVSIPNLPGYNSGYIPAYAYSSPAPTQVTYIIHAPTVNALKSDELTDLMAQAERGGNHATHWQKPDAAAAYIRGGRR